MDVQKQRGSVYRARLDATSDDRCVNYYYFPPIPSIFLHLSAEGNPGPEKIGAFGVGE
jgi:hypothetical protein